MANLTRLKAEFSMPRRKTIELEIKDILELLLKSPVDLILRIDFLKEEDIYEIGQLADEELANLIREQRSDGSFDKKWDKTNNKYFLDFFYRYHLRFGEIGDKETLYNHLKSIKEAIQYQYMDILANQYSLEDHGISSNLKEPEKPFPDWINLPDGKKETFAERLKNEFNTEKGLQIRYMVEGLVNKDLLIIPNRMLSKFYEAMKVYFGRDIGAKSGIFDLKFDNNDPKGKIYKTPEIKTAEKRIDFILNQIL